jgi:two-component system, LytTR family, sensor kinase
VTLSGTTSWSTRRSLALSLAAAGMIGGMFGLQRLILRYAKDQQLMPLETVGVQLVPWLVWALLVPLIVAICALLPLSRARVTSALVAYAVIGVAAALLHTALCVIPIGWLSNWNIVSWPPQIGFTQLLVNRGVAAWTEFALIVAIVQTAHGVQHTRERERSEGALRSQLIDAELRALRMQLEPHFLFNTLNAIHAYIRESPAVAEAMLGDLSGVLRSVLASSERPERPLREELELSRSLLRIHESRFGSRLTVSVSSDEACDRATVPTLVLQPLVENAIVHGVSRRPGPVRVEIRATCTGNRLTLCVTDGGAAHGPATGRDEGHRIGLANTRQRLAQRYGDAAELRIDATPVRTTITIVLPFAPEALP